jgi:hypothetical protein
MFFEHLFPRSPCYPLATLSLFNNFIQSALKQFHCELS